MVDPYHANFSEHRQRCVPVLMAGKLLNSFRAKKMVNQNAANRFLYGTKKNNYMPQQKTAPAKTKTAKRSTQEESALMELFVSSLKDINWAEKNLVKALKKMSKAATSEKLGTAFEEHMTQTEGHVERLAQVFETLGKKPTSKKCDAMEGLISEAEELIEETEDGTEVRDVALIAAAQKVEHYEIATYGTLRTLAATLGLSKAEKLLQQTLDEEKETDTLLTEIAENYVNEQAAQEE